MGRRRRPRIAWLAAAGQSILRAVSNRVARCGVVLVGALGLVLGALVPAAGASETQGLAAATGQPLTYVAIGASDAVGVGASDPAREGWVPRLGERLGPDTRVVNLGVSGTILHWALQQQLPQALAADPDVVTVWLAVNDLNALISLASYQADLDALLGALRQGTHATILVGNVPDLARVTSYQALGIPPALLRWEVARWNRAITTVAARHGATVVDLTGTWSELGQHPEYLSADGFHPSASGYERLAETFYAALVTDDTFSALDEAGKAAASTPDPLAGLAASDMLPEQPGATGAT